MLIWKRTQCYNCDGHGLVSVYSYNPCDFEGAGECDMCDGRGSIAVSPKDRLAKYPGGPFLGSEAGAYVNELRIWK